LTIDFFSPFAFKSRMQKDVFISVLLAICFPSGTDLFKFLGVKSHFKRMNSTIEKE